MRGWKAASAVAVSLLVLGTAHAQDTAGTAEVPDVLDEGSVLDDECAGPPCGYIVPILDLRFPEKPKCGSGQLSFAEGPPEDCLAVMEKGDSTQLDGTMVWYWEASEDGTYPKNTGEDIVITFGGTATNPGWIDAEISCEEASPCEFVIDDQALLADPDNYELRENAQGQQSLWYVFERDITVTFTRTGDPGGNDFDRIEQRSGVIPLFIKGKSSASEPRFKQAFGVEEFRFSACTDDDIAAQSSSCGEPLAQTSDRGIPGLPLVGIVAALGAAVALGRMRRG